MNREIKYLLEEIKDNTQDYIGTNGCLYQDLLREELNLLLDYISNLQNQVQKQKETINKAKKWIYKVQNNKDNKHLEPIISTDKLDELLDILNEVE